MKKIFSLIVVAAACAMVGCCGNANKNAAAAEETKAGVECCEDKACCEGEGKECAGECAKKCAEGCEAAAEAAATVEAAATEAAAAVEAAAEAATK